MRSVIVAVGLAWASVCSAQVMVGDHVRVRDALGWNEAVVQAIDTQRVWLKGATLEQAARGVVAQRFAPHDAWHTMRVGLSSGVSAGALWDIMTPTRTTTRYTCAGVGYCTSHTTTRKGVGLPQTMSIGLGVGALAALCWNATHSGSWHAVVL